MPPRGSRKPAPQDPAAQLQQALAGLSGSKSLEAATFIFASILLCMAWLTNPPESSIPWKKKWWSSTKPVGYSLTVLSITNGGGGGAYIGMFGSWHRLTLATGLAMALALFGAILLLCSFERFRAAAAKALGELRRPSLSVYFVWTTLSSGGGALLSKWMPTMPWFDMISGLDLFGSFNLVGLFKALSFFDVLPWWLTHKAAEPTVFSVGLQLVNTGLQLFLIFTFLYYCGLADIFVDPIIDVVDAVIEFIIGCFVFAMLLIVVVPLAAACIGGLAVLLPEVPGFILFVLSSVAELIMMLPRLVWDLIWGILSGVWALVFG